LLRLIAGFHHADRGRVLVGGDDISGLPPWKRDVGMVFQSYALWPHMTVRRNVAFGLEERRLSRAEINRRVNEALDLVGLPHLGDRRPSQLSGGQQQRVALARTIAVHPKVLLLDEPFSNLDAGLRGQVRRELRELQQRLGITTIFVTHDQEEANTVCDRMAVMNDGAVQQVGTPITLYDRPANLFVARFLGHANVLDGEIVGSGDDRAFKMAGEPSIPIPLGIELPAGAKAVFRPQDARIGPPVDGGLVGTIIHREFLGSVARYCVRIGSTNIVVETPYHLGNHMLETGAAIGVTISLDAIRWVAA
jgi:iron(III) transport system ATP-binding protein